MKMHAEKKHKCDKCTNSYGTIWDLKRHILDCGKTFQCTCGCPYASRTALLSHIYRTQHEIPVEHRYGSIFQISSAHGHISLWGLAFGGRVSALVNASNGPSVLGFTTAHNTVACIFLGLTSVHPLSDRLPLAKSLNSLNLKDFAAQCCVLFSCFLEVQMRTIACFTQIVSPVGF